MLVLPGRHARPSDAILDDVEEFAVGQLLDGLVREVRHLRIHVLAHIRFPVTVNSMARRTVVAIVIGRGSPDRRVRREWIDLLSGVGRNGQASQSRCDHAFYRPRLSMGWGA